MSSQLLCANRATVLAYAVPAGVARIVNAAGGVRGLVIRSLEALEKISLRANLTVASFTFAGPQLTTSQARHMEMLWRTRVDGGELSDFYLM